MARPLTMKFEDLKGKKFPIIGDESEFELDWKETLEHMGKEGASAAGLYTSIRLTKRIHDRLYADTEEYRDVFDYATDLSKTYWIDTMGKKIFKDRNLNSAIYAIQVRNRFGWKQQDDQKPAAPPKEPEQPGVDLIAKHKKPKPDIEQTTN
jgi:hypothetical protein